jgi:hypothetical protein
LDHNPDYASTPLLLSDAPAPEIPGQLENNEEVSVEETTPPPAWWDGTGVEIARATRSWIQYGTLAFAVICIVIGAVEALFGR